MELYLITCINSGLNELDSRATALFGKCSVRILAEAPTTLSKDFLNVPQSVDKTVG
jgi:hypothetical protein